MNEKNLKENKSESFIIGERFNIAKEKGWNRDAQIEYAKIKTVEDCYLWQLKFTPWFSNEMNKKISEKNFDNIQKGI